MRLRLYPDDLFAVAAIVLYAAIVWACVRFLPV